MVQPNSPPLPALNIVDNRDNENLFEEDDFEPFQGLANFGGDFSLDPKVSSGLYSANDSSPKQTHAASPKMSATQNAMPQLSGFPGILADLTSPTFTPAELTSPGFQHDMPELTSPAFQHAMPALTSPAFQNAMPNYRTPSSTTSPGFAPAMPLEMPSAFMLDDFIPDFNLDQFGTHSAIPAVQGGYALPVQDAGLNIQQPGSAGPNNTQYGNFGQPMQQQQLYGQNVPLPHVGQNIQPTTQSTPAPAPLQPTPTTAQDTPEPTTSRRSSSTSGAGTIAGARTTPTERVVDNEKRQRNTAASARFRVKKKMREQALEQRAKDLDEQVNSFRSRIQELETENKWLKSLVLEKNENRPNALSLLKSMQRESASRANNEGSSNAK